MERSRKGEPGTTGPGTKGTWINGLWAKLLWAKLLWAKLRGTLLPEEKGLLLVALLVIPICLSTGTGFTFNKVLYGYRDLFAGNLLMLLIGVRLRAWNRFRLGGVDNVPLWQDFVLFRTTAFLFAYITLYSNLKVRIPVFNRAVHDTTLRAFEHAVLGFDLTSTMRMVQFWPEAATFLDRVYHHDYIFLTFSLFLLTDLGDKPVRRLMVAMGILYLLGISLTIFWPTLGPCFTEREAYRWMQALDLESWDNQGFLVKFYQQHSLLAAERALPLKAISFAGIAALPSLHVGHCLMLCRGAYDHHRRMLWLYVPVTLLTWIATLAFGWHYVSDGLVAIPLVLFSYWLAGRVVGTEGGRG